MNTYSTFAQQMLVFIHLFAFAFAIVMIVGEDIKILISKKMDVGELHKLANRVTILLGVLWVSGIALLAIKPGLDLELILANSKLAAKITVVSVLTINGMLLHLFVFPSFRSPQKFKRILVIASLLSVISTTSWIYAGLVGAARAIAPIMTYQNYMNIYLALLAFALFIGVTVVYPMMKQLLKSTSFNNQISTILLNTSSFSTYLREIRDTKPQPVNRGTEIGREYIY